MRTKIAGASRNFKGDVLVTQRASIRQRVLWAMSGGAERTAWQVAKAIESLGGSVSSEMYRMMKRGELIDTGKTTKLKGRIYRLPSVGEDK